MLDFIVNNTHVFVYISSSSISFLFIIYISSFRFSSLTSPMINPGQNNSPTAPPRETHTQDNEATHTHTYTHTHTKQVGLLEEMSLERKSDKFSEGHADQHKRWALADTKQFDDTGML